MTTSCLFPLALVAVLATGCDDVVGSDREWVEFRASADHYVAGGTATIHIANHTDEHLFANLCDMIVERWAEPVGWVDIDWRGDMPCPIAVPLRPGRESDFDVPLRDDLPTGDYRARVEVGYGGELAELITPTFVVQGLGEL